MALKLLEQVTLARASPLRSWLDALPHHVPLPWLHSSEEELAAIQDPAALAECRQLRDVYEAACQVIEGVASPGGRLSESRTAKWQKLFLRWRSGGS
jgi:hypothetical protein